MTLSSIRIYYSYKDYKDDNWQTTFTDLILISGDINGYVFAKIGN